MEKDNEDLSPDDLKHAAKLLEILSTDGERRSISALARKAAISWYRAARLVERLEQKGLVKCAVQSGRGGSYARKVVTQLSGNGASVKFLGAMMESMMPQHDQEVYVTIMNDARPVLESLARRHNEAIYMAILKGDEVFLLDMVDCLRQEKEEPYVGRLFPFFSNAAGKVIRAIDSWDLLERIARKWNGTRHRAPDLAALREELEEIRANGVAVDTSGMGEGVITVAVAVRDYAGKVVGAVMLLGPSIRLFRERLEEEIIPSLRLEAESLSMKFGYARP